VREGRGSVEGFPVQAAATAPAYDFEPEAAVHAEDRPPLFDTLFTKPNPARVISFESLRSPSERQSIRARAAEISRPEPLPHAKVELKRPKATRKKISESQQRLDFPGIEEVASPPQSHIPCDAPVAPATMRAEAAFIDGAIMLGPVILGLAIFLYEGGSLVIDKATAPFWSAVLFTIPVLYKLLWSWAGRDSVGMSAMGLRLVDFYGNPPTRELRYQRAMASFISFLAAGIGLVWALVDEDALTWHDHMSSTFPTVSTP
jgi:uncharacterized RDD family membrane protein YckC